MKKLLSMALTLVILAALAVPAMAAGTTSFSMSASDSTLHRGDTVTFTVTVSSSEPATSYGLQLSYDSSVLELVNGNCTISGTMVSSFNNGFAFMFQSPTAYSGTVGTVTFRVKDHAAYGNFTISGSASVKNGSTAVNATGASANITVSCNHSYGNWTKVNDTTHKRTCSVCKNDETVSHTWNSGTVTKQPSCKETGIKTYTCTACNAGKTEAIAKTTAHKYGAWTKGNDTTHKRTCSVCSKEETANHAWNSGTITKKASCKEEGVKTFYCTVCNAARTESIAKLTTHTYDHACDTDCNVCGTMRTVTHNYKSAWSKDQTNHWHTCAVCKDKKDAAAHTPGAEATETKAQTCTACGYVIKAALGHKHSFATTWTTDNAGHWYACSGCEEKNSYTAHNFENACDKDCSICGYTRDTDHKFAESWTTDEKNHWHVCSGCGLKEEVAAHEPGAAATATTAQACTICGYVIAPALGTTETTEPVEETNVAEPTISIEHMDVTDSSAPTEKKDSADKDFPLGIILAAALVAAGIVVIVAIKKKKS